MRLLRILKAHLLGKPVIVRSDERERRICMNSSPRLRIVSDELDAEAKAKADEFCELCEGVDPVWMCLTLAELEESILPIRSKFPDVMKRLAELLDQMGSREFQLLQDFNDEIAALVVEDNARQAND